MYGARYETRRQHAVGCTGVAAVVVLAAAPMLVQADPAYVYSDDFSTDQATVDSYAHSAFLEEVPDPLPHGGFLIYEEAVQGDRAVRFHAGTSLDSDARLAYLFPLTPMGGTVGGGMLEFDIVSSLGGHLRVWIGYGAGSEWVDTALSVDHYVYDLSPPDSCQTVDVLLWGDGVWVDNLRVTLECATDVESRSWARIKVLLGRESGPPN